MSINEAVCRLVSEGKLIHRPSSILKISARDMFVTPEIDAIAQAPFADTELGERQAALAAYLDAFSELNEITVSQNPRNKPWDVMLARVEPPQSDFWSMRIVDPDDTPGIRLLGGFCWKDAFVGLTCDYREMIVSFDDEVSNAQQVWSDYFNSIKPHSGEKIDDYLTQYYEWD